MPSLYLFEDSQVERLSPLTYSRAACELRAGSTTLLERFQRNTDIPLSGLFVRDGLAQVVRRRVNVPVNPALSTKDGVILINTSRGPLVNEQNLTDALISGKIYAAGLDVVSVEPIHADNPLLSAPNCFITPHIAWAPKESRKRLMDLAVGNLKAFIEGNAANVVR